jgi:hypothetical protein
MDRNHWLFEEIILDNFQLLLRKVISMIMTSQTVYDIRLLLEHLLKEQKDIQTNIETHSDRADIVIRKAVLAVAEFRNLRLVVLLALLNAKVVNFNIDTVSHLEKLYDVLSIISYCRFDTSGGVTQSNHIVVNVG